MKMSILMIVQYYVHLLYIFCTNDIIFYYKLLCIDGTALYVLFYLSIYLGYYYYY